MFFIKIITVISAYSIPSNAFPSINRPEMIESNLKSLIKYLKGVFKDSFLGS